MSVASGPNVVASGLVLAYDMGNTMRSWRGKPTTNLITNPNANINVQSTDVPMAVSDLVSGYSSYSAGYAVAYWSPTSTAATGVTFSYSMYMRSPGAVSTYLMYVYTGTGGDGGWFYAGSGSLTSDWVRYVYTTGGWTGTVTNVCVYRYNQIGTIEVCAPQFEVNSFATPYTATSRSTSKSLIDLTSNNTLTTTSLTYASDNTFSFSSNYIDIANSSLVSGTNPFTIDAFYNQTGGIGVIIGNYGTSYGTNSVWVFGGGLWLNNSSNYISNYADRTPGKHHICVTRDVSGYVCTYFDGVLEVSNVLNNASVATNINWRIGADVNGPTEPFTGTIYSVKVYNRGLTATEVSQNFQAHRGRYGI